LKLISSLGQNEEKNSKFPISFYLKIYEDFRIVSLESFSYFVSLDVNPQMEIYKITKSYELFSLIIISSFDLNSRNILGQILLI